MLFSVEGHFDDTRAIFTQLKSFFPQYMEILELKPIGQKVKIVLKLETPKILNKFIGEFTMATPVGNVCLLEVSFLRRIINFSLRIKQVANVTRISRIRGLDDTQ